MNSQLPRAVLENLEEEAARYVEKLELDRDMQARAVTSLTRVLASTWCNAELYEPPALPPEVETEFHDSARNISRRGAVSAVAAQRGGDELNYLLQSRWREAEEAGRSPQESRELALQVLGESPSGRRDCGEPFFFRFLFDDRWRAARYALVAFQAIPLYSSLDQHHSFVERTMTPRASEKAERVWVEVSPDLVYVCALPVLICVLVWLVRFSPTFRKRWLMQAWTLLVYIVGTCFFVGLLLMDAVLLPLVVLAEMYKDASLPLGLILTLLGLAAAVGLVAPMACEAGILRPRHVIPLVHRWRRLTGLARWRRKD